jgi:thymidylate kinase
MIICLFGPDGAGKSTVAAKLATLLRLRGLRVKVSWLRGTHGFLSLLASLFRRLGVMRGDCNPYYRICVSDRARGLWFFLEIVAALPLYLARYVLPQRLGYIVVGDRCLVDFIAWLYVTLGKPRNRFLRAMVSFLAVEASRTRLFYLYAEPRVLAERRPEEAHYIGRFAAAYRALARSLPVEEKIDTSRLGVEETVALIAERLGLA